MMACPVKALVHMVHYITNHLQCFFANDTINTYYFDYTKQAHPLQAGAINTLVKMTICLLGLDKKGFPLESVGRWGNGHAPQQY
jgi:hypothetical protein